MQQPTSPKMVGIPFPALFHEARANWRVLGAKDPMLLFAAMAVVVRESGANPLFCKCDQLYKDNMKALTEHTKVTEAEWLQYITLKAPSLMVGIPKFRFEPSWWATVKLKFNHANYTLIETVFLSCSWGYAQKSGLYYTYVLTTQDRIGALKTFTADRMQQLRVLMKDLQVLLVGANGDWHLALTRYNAGPSHEGVTEYGSSVFNTAKNFQGRIDPKLLEV
jgi:hypothetical protein